MIFHKHSERLTEECWFGQKQENYLCVLRYQKYRRKQGVVKRTKGKCKSRNNPIEILCDACVKKLAAYICGNAFAGLQFATDSVCGYSGSDIYPDQFVPDIGKTV